jgi:DNA gyrase subunit A
VLVSLTTANYIKRTDLDTYRKQKRGGHGITGMTTKDEDFVESVFIAGMKDYLLCFTNIGRVYWLKVYEIPESSRAAKGKPIVNLLNLSADEKITAILPVRAFEEGKYVLMATRQGVIKKTDLMSYSHPYDTC